MGTLFYINTTIDGKDCTFTYNSIDSLIQDKSFRVLFDNELVSECEVVRADGKFITKLPIMSWHRLLEQVVANSSTIMELRLQNLL